MTHAEEYTNALLGLYEGPHATKRIASAFNCSLAAAKSYVDRRRALSLTAAIEAAARNQQARDALLARIDAVKAQHDARNDQILARRGGVVSGAGECVRRAFEAGGGEGGAADRVGEPLRTFTVATGLMGSGK